MEHKKDNYALRLAYWSKADYAFDRVGRQTPREIPLIWRFYHQIDCLTGMMYLRNLSESKRFYKIRGAKKYTNRTNHPKFQLFDNILALENTFPEDLKYIFHCLLKVGKFKEIQKSKGYEDYQQLQPGDDYEETRTAQFNNTHMPVDTIEEYEKRGKRSKIKDKVLFERYAAKGVEYVHGMMIRDDLHGRISKK